MNIIKKAFSKKSYITEAPMTNFIGGYGTASGTNVNPRTVLQHQAVYTCVTTLADDIAKIPLKIERRVNGGWKQDRENPLNLLLQQPNERHVIYELIQQTVFNALTTGDGFIICVRDNSGIPIRLIPTAQFSTQVVEDVNDGALYYRTTDNILIPYKTSIRSETGASRIIYHDDMIRIKNISYDNGINGVSAIQIAREAFGLAIATQEAAARAMNNGAHINGYFKSSGATGGAQKGKLLKEELTRNINGILNSGQTAIIEGLDYVSIDRNVSDLQLIEARKQVTLEVCQMFRVPTYKLGLADSEKAANISEQEQSYISNTLTKYTKPLEQHMDRVLLNSNQRNDYRFRFDFTKVAEPNEQIRSAYYQSAITMGWMSPNEVREREDLAPTPDGDYYLHPSNTGVIGDNQNPHDLTSGEMNEDKNT